MEKKQKIYEAILWNGVYSTITSTEKTCLTELFLNFKECGIHLHFIIGWYFPQRNARRFQIEQSMYILGLLQGLLSTNPQIPVWKVKPELFNQYETRSIPLESDHAANKNISKSITGTSHYADSLVVAPK